MAVYTNINKILSFNTVLYFITSPSITVRVYSLTYLLNKYANASTLITGSGYIKCTLISYTTGVISRVYSTIYLICKNTNIYSKTTFRM